MTSTTVAEQLAQIPLLRNLPQKSFDQLARIGTDREFAPGQLMMEEGQEGVGVFLILEGDVELTRNGKQIATVKAGEALGEMAIIDHFRRSATATAKTAVKCLVISRWDFMAELKAEPEIAIALLRELSTRLREMDARLAEK
jgi:CRP/FNR family transcriptional regulator, cyclic AMP receptor protein